MKTVILIHGMPTKEEYLDSSSPISSERNWFPWLKKQLIAKGYKVETPEMPIPYDPQYEKWKAALEAFPVDEETVLIGHSCGGGFLVRWLSEHDVKVGKTVLVAPWIDIEGELTNGFFDFLIDQNLVNKTTDGISMLYSTDDEDYILKSVEKIKLEIKDIKIREFSDKGHFCDGDGVTTLPEVLEEIK